MDEILRKLAAHEASWRIMQVLIFRDTPRAGYYVRINTANYVVGTFIMDGIDDTKKAIGELYSEALRWRKAGA